MALDTIRSAAGTRGFVPGTGKNVVSMGHGAGYMDFSSPEYQERMRAFTEKGEVSDLFKDMPGSRSSTQERAKLQADVEKHREEARQPTPLSRRRCPGRTRWSREGY